MEWLHRQVLRHLLVELISDPRHEVTHRADNPANTTQRCATTTGRGIIIFICLLGGFVLGLVIVIICRLAVIPTILAVGVVLIITSVLPSLTTVILVILVVLATIILRRGLLLPRDSNGAGITLLIIRIWLDKGIFYICRFLCA